MLASITPLGERGRNRRWGHTAAFYVAGSVAGGAGRGAILGGIGALLPASMRPSTSTVALVLAFLLAVAAVAELAGWPITRIGPQRQVNEDWLDTYRGWVVGAGFGFQLGFGLMTYITTAAFYVVLAAEVLTLSWRAGLALGAVFGLARALPVLGAAFVTSPRRLRAAHRSLQRAAGTAHGIVAAGCGVAAFVLAAGAWG